MPSLIATLGGNISPFIREMHRAKHEAHGVGQEISHGFKEILGEKLVEVAGVVALEQAIEKTIEYARHIEDVSLRLGISTEAVQQWEYALKQTGGSIDSLKGFFEKLAIARGKALGGDVPAVESFKKLGVAIEELKSKRLEDIGKIIGETFEHGDPQQLIASLRSVGGRGAGEMTAAFRAGLGEMFEEHRRTIGSMDESTVESLAKTGKAWERAKESIVVNVFAPMIEGVLKIVHAVESFLRPAFAGIVGPLLGLINGIKQFDSAHPFSSLANIGSNMADAPKNLMHAWEEERKAEEAAELAKKERLKKGIGSTDLDSPESKKEIRELERLNRLTEEEARRGRLAAMNSHQKLDALKEEISLLEKKNSAEDDPVEKAKGALELTKLRNELAKDEREINKEAEREALETQRDQEREAKGHHESVFKTQSTALASSAGYLGSYVQAPEVVTLDTAKKSEGHLHAIKEHMHAVRKGIEKISGGNQSADSVQF